jgi:Disulfide bond formation protein DsbB
MDYAHRRPRPFRPEPARLSLAALVAIGLGALAMALVGQYVFGLVPCVLCLYQRAPYAVVAGLAALGLVLPLSAAARRRLIAASGVVFLLGAGLAFYHVGVEHHWWGAVTGCAGTPVAQLTVDQLQSQLWTPQKPCDQVDFRFIGLSLAGWNAIMSLALALGCVLQTARLGSRRRP